MHYHCIQYYAYDIIFIHLAFSAFCVCIIRRHSCCIRHMLHSSSVAFKGPSAFICISCSLHFDIYALPYHCVAFSAVAFRYQRYALRCIQHTLHTHALNCISDGLHSAPNAYVRMWTHVVVCCILMTVCILVTFRTGYIHTHSQRIWTHSTASHTPTSACTCIQVHSTTCIRIRSHA